MYPLGHFAVAYFVVGFFRRFIREDYSILFVMVASVIPDVGLLFSPYIVHRGPTHSVIVMTMLFLPVYLYLRRGLPYYIALVSHSLIGDYFTGLGLQLFWPLTGEWYKASRILRGTMLTLVEVGLFILMLLHMGITHWLRKSR